VSALLPLFPLQLIRYFVTNPTGKIDKIKEKGERYVDVDVDGWHVYIYASGFGESKSKEKFLIFDVFFCKVFRFSFSVFCFAPNRTAPNRAMREMKILKRV